MKFVSLCLPFYNVFQNGRVGIWNRKFRSGSRILHKVFDQRYIDDDVGSFASEASYCFILGLIPFMIFLVNCILFFAAPQLDTILDLLQYLPAQFAASMEENIARIMQGGVRYGFCWSRRRSVDRFTGDGRPCPRDG